MRLFKTNIDIQILVIDNDLFYSVCRKICDSL